MESCIQPKHIGQDKQSGSDNHRVLDAVWKPSNTVSFMLVNTQQSQGKKMEAVGNHSQHLPLNDTWREWADT